MTWYKAYYGSYKDGEGGIRRIKGTFSRKEMFRKAHEVANETRKTVIVEAERGMNSKFYEVKPE